MPEVSSAEAMGSGVVSQTFFLSLVCQHGTEGDIADAFHALDAGIVLVVDHHAPFAVHLNTNLVQAQVCCQGSTTDRNEKHIGLDLLTLR